MSTVKKVDRSAASSTTQLFVFALFDLILSYLSPSSFAMSTSAEQQHALKGDDRLAGLAHSEVHYFNRQVHVALSLSRQCCFSCRALLLNVMLIPCCSYNHHGIHEEMLVRNRNQIRRMRLDRKTAH